MTPHPPPAGPSPAPAPPETLPPARRRRRWPVFAVAALLLSGAAGAGVWWFTRPPRVGPPMPAAVPDPEVRAALEDTRRKVLENPDSADLWGKHGMMLLAQLFDPEAEICFAEAARLNPDDPMWPYAKGRIAGKRNRQEESLDLLRRAYAASASRPEYRSPYRLPLAEALLERQELDEAEALFEEEWRSDPGNPRAALGLGLIAVARGDDGKAEKLLRAAYESPHARVRAGTHLAALARARDDRPAAARYEKEAASLSADPPWPDPFFDRVVALQGVGRRGRERLVILLEKQGRYAEAVDVCLKQIELEPNTQAYVGAAINLARLGEYDRAWGLLGQALRGEPDNTQAHYTLALTLYSRAEKELARDPDSARAREWLREAVPHARRATELKPDHGRAYLFWGLALKDLGEPEAALDPLRKALACLPSDFSAQFGLGEALLATGRLDEAARHLENARKLEPQNPRVAKALERLRTKQKG